jgi:phenylacetate-coenzyme A ligase PaaK-like adenylate-forming protein
LFKEESEIFNIISEEDFNTVCLKIFRFQYASNAVYRSWANALKVKADDIGDVRKIPFLPIGFFKRSPVVSSPVTDKTVIFQSSATTSQIPSQHYVNNISVYEKSFRKGFSLFYGKPSEYCILALLPGYLERKNSSLVYMVNRLIEKSGHPQSGFFLHDTNRLLKVIEELKRQKQKTLLIGVSYALMDLCGKVKLDANFTVMETGGMKGKRKEMLKEELHTLLRAGLGTKKIHSEYGMTELLSQAYSQGDRFFKGPPWMRFYTREVTDPLKLRYDDKTGGINVIDLANVYSCSFIATQDLGKIVPGRGLELMGRYDNSDIRGCNLMY